MAGKKKKSRKNRKKEKKAFKKETKRIRKERKREYGSTFNKTKNVLAATYYFIGIAFFIVTFLILMGILIL